MINLAYAFYLARLLRGKGRYFLSLKNKLQLESGSTKLKLVRNGPMAEAGSKVFIEKTLRQSKDII